MSQSQAWRLTAPSAMSWPPGHSIRRSHLPAGLCVPLFDPWCTYATLHKCRFVLQVLAGDTPYSSASSFEDLQLSQALLRGLYSEMKFEKPSRIQAETLPLILQPPHMNLIAQV